METYNKFRYLYPPRTSSSISYDPDSTIYKVWHRDPGSIAQFKLNGTNSLVVVHPDRTIKFWNRHKEQMDYELPDNLKEQVLSFSPAGKFSIYNAELLHTKIRAVRNVLYFFDTLVFDDQYLTGVAYEDRLKILSDNIKTNVDINQIKNNQLYVAHNIPPSGWDEAWKQALASIYCEGLVLKDSAARLAISLGVKNNEAFMCRVRKPSKNFQH